MTRIRRPGLHLELALIGLILAAAGCPGRSPGGRYNVILISIDTLRADRLGAYGYARDTSPSLDLMADRAVVFDHVVAECSWTLPSHITMLTGLYPSTHGVALPTHRPGPDTRFLSEILLERGYRTLGLTDGGYVDSLRGFSRGFEIFDDTDHTLSETLDRAAVHLAELSPGDRFFFFLHTYDVHCPYDPAPEYAARFRTPDAQVIETAGRCGNPDYNSMLLSEAQIRHLSNQYDGSIREADEALGRFLALLEEEGQLDRTVVIVTSDHGEEFGDHGQIGHERTLYREALMVPLVVLAPGLAPRRVGSPTGLVDITPTILGLLELPVPADMEGADRTPLMTGADGAGVATTDGDRVSELEWKIPMRSVMTGADHLILTLKTDRARLFDLNADPAELDDVAGDRPERVAELRGVLDDYGRARRPREPEMIIGMPPGDAERLRNLGYLD